MKKMKLDEVRKNRTGDQNTADGSKSAEELHRESENKYHTIIESIEDGYYELDLSGNFTFFNDALCRMHGRSRKELMGMNFKQYLDEENIKIVFQAYNKVYKTGKPCRELSLQAKIKDGAKMSVEISISLQKDSSGKPLGFRGIVRDVTERKQTEEKLFKEQQRFKALTDQSSDVIVIVNRKGIITYENPSVKILGINVKKRIGASAFDNIHPDDLKRVKKEFNKVFKDINSPVFRSEVRIHDKDGSWRIFEIVAGVLVQGNIVESVIVNLRDITERKQVEKKLRESEENYRQLYNNAPAGIYRIDFKSGKFLKANDLFCHFLGYCPEEITSVKTYDILTKESRKLFEERMKKISQGVKVPEIVEYEVIDKNGRRLIFQLINKYIYDAEGRIVASDVVAHDITRRKLTEDALRRERDLSDVIINSLPGIFYVVDEEYRFLRYNDNFLRITGYSAKQLRRMTVLDFHNQEDRSAISAEIQKGFRIGEYLGEANIVLKDGTERTILFSSKRVQYEGRPCILGTGIDISDKKRAEEELTRFAENLEDANIALRVLMNSKNKDQKEFEEKLQVNINDLVIPYLKKLNKAKLDDRSKNYVSTLENNLSNILSPFIRDFRSSHKNLTPQEIQIVDLIMKGKNTKEIADMLNSSVNTIATHRNNIRKKLNLRKSKINLRSHILSLK
jgi:PAS domain S-box-containing protein